MWWVFYNYSYGLSEMAKNIVNGQVCIGICLAQKKYLQMPLNTYLSIKGSMMSFLPSFCYFTVSHKILVTKHNERSESFEHSKTLKGSKTLEQSKTLEEMDAEHPEILVDLKFKCELIYLSHILTN